MIFSKKEIIGLVVFCGVFAAFGWLVGSKVFAAQDVCYDIASTTDELTLTSQFRHAQQYTPVRDITLEAVGFNVYGNPADSGDFVHWISETSGSPALPTGVMVTNSLVNKPSNVVPDASPGPGQAFVCLDQPTINHTFTYGAPVVLTGGTTYALIIYHDTGGHTSQIGFVRNNTGIAPEQGLQCVGVNCPTHTGWAVNTFAGDNWDITYNIQNLFVDPSEGSANDGKIDSHIDNLREYLQLDGANGGLLFSLAVVSIVFAVGLIWKIPFMVIAMFNTLMVGAAARAGIMPPWILLAVLAVAGLALVFTLANRGGGTNEG